jgi:PBSX family phage terminase large subunit
MLPVIMVKNPEVNALVVRKVGGTLKDSVFNQILWGIDELGLGAYFKATKSPLEITYIPTGQKVFFRGADDPLKIKSIKPKQGYIGITWFEELDQFKGEEEIRSILQSANRGGSVYWNFFTFNPPKSRDNWANIAIQQERPDKITIHSTYLDVPVEWLGEQFIVDAEELKKSNPTAYEHEYLGLAVGTGGTVFENVNSRTITDAEIERLGYFYYGVDFGFAVDPFVWVKIAYDKASDTIYFIDEIYQVKLGNKKAVELISEKSGKEHVITADSAEPRTISEFRGLGLSRIIGAKKGPDSVDHGVTWLQNRKSIVIDKKRTPNVFRVFTLYEYDKDRYGNFISRFPDKDNHTIDAARYALESVIGRKTIKTVDKSKLGIY